VLSVWTTWPTEPGAPRDDRAGDITHLTIDRSEEARLEVAHSVLLLNLSGELPPQILWDAAFFGIACVGRSGDPNQHALWPEAEALDEAEAIALARSLLTNAAFSKRVGKAAHDSICKLRNPDAREIAEELRGLWTQHSASEALVC
jgi:hypothetical protein